MGRNRGWRLNRRPARKGTSRSCGVETFSNRGVIGGMPSFFRPDSVASLRLPLMAAATFGFALSADVAGAERLSDPLRFFEGRTESTATVKVIARRPYKSRSVGRGEIRDDGALHLVQRVEDEGKSPYERRWLIRQVAPGRFSGTMSEATGPVTVDEMGGRYRFRFKMKGNVSVEQWLTPLPGGRAARSKVTIRKFGMTVGKSDGMIRKF